MSIFSTNRVNLFLDAVRLELHDKRLTAALSGRIGFAPWSDSPWPGASDGINARWRGRDEPSPAEKFAIAFGLDVQPFVDSMSRVSGVDASSSGLECLGSDGRSACPGDLVCGVRRGSSRGRCISPSAGLQDAWGRAAMEVELPPCPVEKNGVTFYPRDLQALVSQFYFISNRRSLRMHNTDPRDVMRFGREYRNACIDFPFRHFYVTDEGVCHDITPAVFHEVLLSSVGMAQASLLVRWSSHSYFVPAVREFGRSFQSNFTSVENVASRASVVTMELDWINLSLEPQQDSALSVVRTTLKYVVEVWMDRETTGGAWLPTAVGPPSFVPVSLELISPLTLEEDAESGLTSERLDQLLHASVQRCDSSADQRNRPCNRTPVDVVLAKEARRVKRCELATGYSFSSLKPIEDTAFMLLCREKDCIHVVDQLRRIEFQDCVFPGGFSLASLLSKAAGTCINYSFSRINGTSPQRTRPPPVEPSGDADSFESVPAQTRAPRPTQTKRNTRAPIVDDGSKLDGSTPLEPPPLAPVPMISLPPHASHDHISIAPASRPPAALPQPQPPVSSASDSKWPTPDSAETQSSARTASAPSSSPISASTIEPAVRGTFHFTPLPSLPPGIGALRVLSEEDAWFIVASGFIALSVLLIELVVLIFRWKTRQQDKRIPRRTRPRNLNPTISGTLLPGVSLWAESLLLDRYIPTTHIHDVRVLGGGAFGVVFLVRLQNRQLAASKRLATSQRHDSDAQQQLIDEIKVAATLEHPNVVALIGASWTTRADVQAVFEFMPLGDLRSRLETTEQAPWDRPKLLLALDVAYALAYLHSQRPTALVHRDIKSSNVLLRCERSRVRAKLSDFGVCREVSSNASMTTPVGTSRWLAPEIILGRATFDTSCDVYAFGVVLSELDTHRVPFSELTGADGAPLPTVAVLQKVAHERAQPSLAATCPEALASLARQCMAYDAADRPSASAVCKALLAICREPLDGEGDRELMQTWS
ncbi:hypothetical protein ATCC90586_002747 [Pythium insidiosum]|nr:hypothetical protein ATCC90586_002747 [Pythium insidiosum]